MVRSLKVLLTVSLFFAGVFSFLLILNSFQLNVARLSGNPVLETARNEAASGSEEQKSFYRDLHLMVRRVFFLKISQIAFARWFLIMSLGLTLFSFQTLSILGKRPPLSIRVPGRPMFSRALAIAILVPMALIPSAAVTGSVFTELWLKGFEKPTPEVGSDTAAAQGEECTEEEGSCVCEKIKELQSVYLAVTEDSEGNWSGFRGSSGTGVERLAKPPVAWNGVTGENIRAKTLLSRTGKSSPIVWGSHIYVTGTDGTDEGITCIDLDSGKTLWDRSLKSISGSTLPGLQEGETDERAASTPAADSNGVYVFFDNGTIAGFSHTGTPLWKQSAGKPDIAYGYASSLRCYGRRLFVQLSVNGPSSLLVIDTATGKKVSTIRLEEGPSWASPVIIDTGREVLLSALDEKRMILVSPLDGKVFWRLELLSGEVAPSAAYDGGTIYAVSPNSSLHSVDLYKGQALWVNHEGATTDVSSPVAVDGLVYCAASYGVLFCFDGKTGTMLWTDEQEAGWNASPLVLGDMLYLFDKTGSTRIYPLTTDKPEPRVNILGADGSVTIDATPAYADGRLYVRAGMAEGNVLFIIGEKS